MRGTLVVLKRELAGYFGTPLAYVFLIMFLVLNGVLLWWLGNFYEQGQADLRPFFFSQPLVYLALIPALSMRLWAEERRSGTIESLFTLPITMGGAVLGKFLAAWLFIGVALLLTMTNWISVSYLGDPDNGVILAGYVGTFLMAGAYLAIGSLISALTKNQVIAFVITMVVCLLLYILGLTGVIDWMRGYLPTPVVDQVRQFSLMTHFQAIARGVLDMRDAVFFLSLIGLLLYANAVAIDATKAR
ncbi:MAG: ABC transporter permease subunit [Planctomycetota bacterium]